MSRISVARLSFKRAEGRGSFRGDSLGRINDEGLLLHQLTGHIMQEQTKVGVQGFCAEIKCCAVFSACMILQKFLKKCKSFFVWENFL